MARELQILHQDRSGVRRWSLTNVGHGVRTVLNVAYRMAFTSHALVTGATDPPTLLVIDSLRKNVSYRDDDQQLTSRFYTHFLDHITAVRQGTTLVCPSQVIIVDNDLPCRLPGPPARNRAQPGDPLVP
ncbi:hypothetical protein AB0C76_15475 [Kitasatospora sp. NPDC048722]|uniref:hypothetical protein n=1 Tax=Kitasatospora sp. NPDC048722 TaxID=3155639 RepID=UPI003400ACD8